MTESDNAILVLAREIGRLADSIDHLAVASQALSLPQMAPAPPGMPAAGPSGPPGGPPGKPEKTVEQKMAAKVFAISKSNDWDIASVAASITGRPMDADSRTWTRSELAQVLDQYKIWGYG